MDDLYYTLNMWGILMQQVPVAENGTVGVAQDYANYYDQSPFTEFSVVTTFPEPNGLFCEIMLTVLPTNIFI